MDSIYVYYKVGPTDARAVLEAARDLLARVKQQTGISGALLRRREQPGTWMEVYEGIGDLAGFEAALNEALTATDFMARLANGQRHTERFTRLETDDLALLGAPPAP
jgi:quinol monooxygenase YgiN